MDGPENVELKGAVEQAANETAAAAKNAINFIGPFIQPSGLLDGGISEKFRTFEFFLCVEIIGSCRNSFI